MNLQNPVKTFDLIVGIDHSDATLAICTLEPSTGKASEESIDSSPEAVHLWWIQLRVCFPDARVAVAFEQPAANLIAFFSRQDDITLYGLNPSATWAHRQSLTVSRARTDESDARDIAYFVERHYAKLTPCTLAPGYLRRLQSFCEARRGFIDQRTALTNRLQALLKNYYPQALPMLHEHIWRPINLDFLRKWPAPQALRLAIVKDLVPLTDDPDIIEPAVLEMKIILDQIEVLNDAVQHYDREIEKLCSQQARYSFFRELPGAGPALAPRIFAAFAQHAPHCENAARFAALCGMAPVTDQSGRTCRVYRRMRCDHFLRQTIHEWAKESWKHSTWARAFVRHHQKKNKSFHTIIRMLGIKWIRNLMKCWQDGAPYNEEKYLQILRSRGCEYLAPAA